MNVQNFQEFALPALIVAFFVWRIYRFKKIKKLVPGYLKQGAIIVDVRSNSEFSQGANAISLNIPLSELNSRAKEFDKEKIIILCCASGSRSSVALGILKKNGFKNVVNAGPWTNTITKELC